MGPILIFDKSTLQSLSIDEAVWLDTFFYANITPLFFVETLADLEKKVAVGRTPEKVVGSLAEKTPIQSGRPNAHHGTLCLANLLGHPVPMDNRIVLPGGRYVIADGRRGVINEHPQEMEALNRWQQGEFLEVERLFAWAWRSALSELDLDNTRVRMIGGAKIRDLADAKRAAEEIVRQNEERYFVLRLALDRLQIPNQFWGDIIRRWKAEDGPRLVDFAPYAAYVLTVEMFFSFATGAGLESTERQSHKIDLAYLYYLPFCMVFTSNDKFHERTAPLFLTGEQIFIRGSDLKNDLGKLDEHYSQLPEAVREQGIMRFVFYPPIEGEFLVSQLWDRLMVPDWREKAKKKPEKIPKEAQERIVKELKRLKTEGQPTEPFGSDVAEYVMIERQVPTHRGKWRLLPPEVEKYAEEQSGEK